MKSTKLPKEKRQSLLKEFGGSEKNSGATEVQVAIFTERINYLTEHFKTHQKDHHSRFGLINLVSKRKRLLEYLKKTDSKRYTELIKRLKLRK